MRKLLLPLAASVALLSSAAFAQTSDSKAPSTTGPAAQSGDNMSKGEPSALCRVACSLPVFAFQTLTLRSPEEVSTNSSFGLKAMRGFLEGRVIHGENPLP